jgi:pantothenate kinase-related protein Tda10
MKCLQEFLENVKEGKNAKLPKFNKLLKNGLGDVDNLVDINKKYDVVILEGWMIGYKPRQYIPSYLRTFNRELEKYQFLHTMFDLWFYFDTDLQNIYDWRYSAEKNMNKETFDQFMKPYFIIYSSYVVNENKNIYYLDKNRNIIDGSVC